MSTGTTAESLRPSSEQEPSDIHIAAPHIHSRHMALGLELARALFYFILFYFIENNSRAQKSDVEIAYWRERDEDDDDDDDGLATTPIRRYLCLSQSTMEVKAIDARRLAAM